MSGSQIIWDAPGSAAPPPIKWDDEKQPGFLDREIPLDSYKNATLSGVQSIGRGFRDAGRGLVQTAEHPIEAIKSLGDLPSEVKQVPAAIHDIDQSSDPVGTYAKVAQDTAGQGAAQATIGAATEGIGKVAGPPIVRGVVKGINRGLEKAPGSIGAAIGAATPVPGGSMIGYALGKELLPKLRIPGEEFGLPKPVFPGAHLPEAPPVFPGANLPEHPGTFTGAHLPEAPPPEVLQARGLAEGTHSGEPLPGGALKSIPKPRGMTAPETMIPKPSAPIEKPAFPPEPPRFRGSSNDIREVIHSTPEAGTPEDQLDDHALQQEMNEDLEKHGWKADSDARKEFIARNSTGETKGSLIAKANAARATAASARPVEPTPADADLEELGRKSIEMVKARKGKIAKP